MSVILNIPNYVKDSRFSQHLESRRENAVVRLREISTKLVYEKSVVKLRETFSPEAQSALIKVTQLAMWNNFSRIAEVRLTITLKVFD